ncbi:MAG: TetR/AcrR family transcriptional regulator [Candidatus Marinimicrobia bacterium]|nr:TetR/AcrR family transcriptional regulator [bacterium]MCG2717050.1 TetR/AcrR family transcriptional regulator [Candidatus Neomarinimicrobiota bacterium]
MKKESRKKTQIVQAADQLFKKFGIKKVTVEEICQEAGASKMTFYKYFKNKTELVKYNWQLMIDDSMAKLDELDKMDIPFTEKIKIMLKMKEEATSQMGNQYIRDYLNMIPDLLSFYNEMFSRVMARFMDMIARAQEKGEVRKTMRPEFFLAVVQKMMELAKNENLVDLYKDYTEFALEVNNFLYYGILPSPESERQ